MTTGTPCRCCGSPNVSLKGRKPGRFIRREFEFRCCADCGFIFVEPFSGFAIYDNAYYRGDGPDPYVDYETEYRDWRQTDRGLELDDLAGIADSHLRCGEALDSQGAGSREQGAGTDMNLRTSARSNADRSAAPAPAPCSLPPAPLSAPSPSSLLPSPAKPSLLPSPTATGAARPLQWLDFGCGAGGLLKYLRERGMLAGRPLEVTGHDVGSYATSLRQKDGFRILDLDELDREPAGCFDVISMIEVIEHLADPSAAMALVARLLAPGGLLLLTTGNLDSPVARRHGIHYRYCAPEIHVSLFNPHCLARLYRRHGLQPHAVRYCGTVKFKVVKSLRHHQARRALARVALFFPPTVWFLDWLYGVSAMPCAVKPAYAARAG